MPDFISTYFLNAFVVNGLFNPINTVALSIILIIAALGVYKLLNRLKIPIDSRFFLAILPFIFWASATRSLRDFTYKLASVVSSGPFFTDISYNFSAVFTTTQLHILRITGYQPLADFYALVVTFFPTPGSYFITFFAALISLLIALGIQRASKNKIPYWKPMFLIGLILSALTIWFLPLTNFLPFFAILGTTIIWMALIYGISRLLKKPYFSKHRILQKTFSPINQLVLGSHFLDASATFFALSNFGYFEQHVLPTFLINIFGPIAMFPLKAVVVLLVLGVIEKYAETSTLRGKDFKNFLKIVIIILGLAPGLRDLLRLVAGV